MTSGIVFDIKEFAVHDGPGIRTTVFLKGCPLNCSWCHNPEGMSPEPQVIRAPGSERIAGRRYAPAELAAFLNRQADILRANDGGVTFSGGEPLMQAQFVAEVIDLLDNIHVLLDTCAYGTEADFRLLAGRSDLVHFDLKLIAPQVHERYTGRSNDCILRNLRLLDSLQVPFVVRVPLIPGVTDSDENLGAIAEEVRGMDGLLRVDLLPYNKAAGGKYEAAGMVFRPDFDESREVNVNEAVFRRAGLEVRVG